MSYDITDWRAAHHWMRGWSDKLAGKEPAPTDANYADAYMTGYAHASCRVDGCPA